MTAKKSNIKSDKFQDIQKVIEAALQGLAFWIGHRRAMYRDWDLLESSLVAEFVNLLMANKGSAFVVSCENNYFELFPKLKENPGIITQMSRVDICGLKEKDKKPPLFVLEVKRTELEKKSKKKKIRRDLLDNDLLRLATIKKLNPKVRCFFVLVSENWLPKEFVNVKGNAYKQGFKIKDSNFKYSIKRVLKASASFRKKEHAHYCCLIEISPPKKGVKK